MSKRESVRAAVVALRAQGDWLDKINLLDDNYATPHENAVMVLKMARAIRESVG